jgi:DNA-directed RNA polymerase subunit K/omega|tara:strand:- start:22146 stop:22913 length:768 start_codon:yes stop_codon:yes gene_type:complete
MSDLEDSDNEENEDLKTNYDEIDSKSAKNKSKNKLSKSILSELKADSDNDEDDDEDPDAEIEPDAEIDPDADDEIDEPDDDSEDEDLIGIDENELQKITTDKKTPIETGEENYNTEISPINSDVDSDDEEFLQKFDFEVRDKYVNENHPECLLLNSTQIDNLCQITRDKDNNIIDDNHKTAPFLSKFEKTKVIGQRIKQLNIGDRPFISVSKGLIDNSIIAEEELLQKKLPFIIRRPISNKTSEYWYLSDLEIIN